MSVLEMNNIQKHFGDLEVLKDISLSVNKGEVLSIIGPSGSGKSTLLRCAVNLEKIDGGKITYNNDVMPDTQNGKVMYAKKNELKEIRDSFGLVFQNFNLFPHYSVWKNVIDAPIHVQKRDRAEVEKTAMELLEKMGIADKKDSYPCQLSGGQQQRVSIVRALAMEPDILFFDEPTSALNPELTQEILKVIKELPDHKAGRYAEAGQRPGEQVQKAGGTAYPCKKEQQLSPVLSQPLIHRHQKHRGQHAQMEHG